MTAEQSEKKNKIIKQHKNKVNKRKEYLKEREEFSQRLRKSENTSNTGRKEVTETAKHASSQFICLV